jgi:hypothetical protein
MCMDESMATHLFRERFHDVEEHAIPLNEIICRATLQSLSIACLILLEIRNIL